MQITNFSNSNANTTVRVAPASANNQTTTYSTSAAQQNNAGINNLPVNQTAIANDVTAMRYEINEMLQQFSEWVRVSSESRRIEFLYNMILKERHGNSELFGKIMDIARRIMRNEDVSAEEMRFLAEYNPRLLYVVTMLKEDSPDTSYDKERRRARDRRGKDRRLGSRRRDQAFRSHDTSDPPEGRILERRNHHAPREMVRQINSLIVDKRLRKSYDATKKKRKHLSVSINTVITSPHETDTDI